MGSGCVSIDAEVPSSPENKYERSNLMSQTKEEIPLEWIDKEFCSSHLPSHLSHGLYPFFLQPTHILHSLSSSMSWFPLALAVV